MLTIAFFVLLVWALWRRRPASRWAVWYPLNTACCACSACSQELNAGDAGPLFQRRDLSQAPGFRTTRMLLFVFTEFTDVTFCICKLGHLPVQSSYGSSEDGIIGTGRTWWKCQLQDDSSSWHQRKEVQALTAYYWAKEAPVQYVAHRCNEVSENMFQSGELRARSN